MIGGRTGILCSEHVVCLKAVTDEYQVRACCLCIATRQVHGFVKNVLRKS